MAKPVILLVDDERAMINMLGKMIERKGKKVLIASNGEEAITLYKKNKPRCVFLDIKLPDIDGEEVIERIKEFDKCAKIYFMSAIDNSTHFSKQRIKELGVIDYLTKPIDVDKMMKIIDKL
ncbi:MAG: response regulator [Candidatus Omnitrophota bacterium]|nr:MAG: response regulator [Candidatus Omnitrophota bacterium]